MRKHIGLILLRDFLNLDDNADVLRLWYKKNANAYFTFP